MSEPRRLAIIPAKGASVRFPRKNVARLAGRTLLQHAVDAARESGAFARIVISTEDELIAQAARDAGADVPFLRSAELARDPATILDVVRDALDRLAAQGDLYDVVAILLPTAPLRTGADVAGAIHRHAAAGRPILTTVNAWEHPPLNAYVRRPDGSLLPLHPDYAGRLGARANALPDLVRLNGAVTVADVAYIRAGRTFADDPVASYEIPAERGIDVDSPLDLQLAEALLAERTSDRSEA